MKTNKSFKKQPLIYWCTYLSAIEEHFKILIELATWLCKICTIHKLKYCHSPIYTIRGKNEGPFNCREINSLNKIFLVCTLKDGDLFTEWIFIEDWRTVFEGYFLKENSVNATRKLQWGKNRLKPNLVVLFDYIDFFWQILGSLEAPRFTQT